MTIKIHITLIILLLYNYFFGKVESLFITYLFIIMHELSHMIMALCLHVDIIEIHLLPLGVNAKYFGKISHLKEFLIAIIGPIASLVFAIIYNNDFYFLVNTCIIIFNLIPIYPLDGGRILRVLLKKFFGETRGKNISTYMNNILVIILFLISIFMLAYYKNCSLLIMSLYILKISTEEIKKDKIIKAINYLQI